MNSVTRHEFLEAGSEQVGELGPRGLADGGAGRPRRCGHHGPPRRVAWHSASECSESARRTTGHLARRHRQADVTPSPTRTSASSGSPADSPQTPIGRPAVRRPRTRRPTTSSTAGCHGSSRSDSSPCIAVGGHRVLREVVGAERAEVDLGEHVRGPAAPPPAPRSSRRPWAGRSRGPAGRTTPPPRPWRPSAP